MDEILEFVRMFCIRMLMLRETFWKKLPECGPSCSEMHTFKWPCAYWEGD